MQNRFFRLVAQLLIVSLCALPYSGHAALVGTDRLVNSAQQQSERDRVGTFLGRGDVQQQLQLFGLTEDSAKQRVAAMTDEEVRNLAGKIDSMPAGANNNGWAWAVVIVIAIIIYMNWK